MTSSAQANLKRKIDSEIETYLNKKVFTACSLGFFTTESGKFEKKIYNYGKTGFEDDSINISDNTVYDLASLTKPLVTSLLLMIFVNKGIIKFEDNLKKFFNNLSRDKCSIKISHLLTHTSGLPAHRPYFEVLLEIPLKKRLKHITKLILSEPLCYRPGTSCIYSDLGFILLGCIIEMVTGEKLDFLFKKFISDPLKINKLIFFKNQLIINNDDYAETGICTWSKRKLKGLVNDDNCRALGGVAGHAGLFGTISGVLKYCEIITEELSEKTKIFNFSGEVINYILKKNKNSTWICGFDTPSAVNSSSGKYFSDISFGHLGFTGTSFWIDLKTGTGIVLLTNRVLCGENLNYIREFRKIVHDLIMKKICKNVFIDD